MPASPELIEILRRHIATFPTSPGGRLFVTRIGRAGVPLPPPFTKPLRMGTAYRVWTAARAAAFTDAEYASPLAKRPYEGLSSRRFGEVEMAAAIAALIRCASSQSRGGASRTCRCTG